MIATAVPLLIAGADPNVLWALANLMQLLYYLLFFNVEYPWNVKAFLAILSAGRFELF